MIHIALCVFVKHLKPNMIRRCLRNIWVLLAVYTVTYIEARVNLAIHKEARQSSTVIPEWSAAKAVDDNLKTCSETSPGQPVAWLTVDLNEYATIDQIGIYFRPKYENRSDLSGFSIYLSSTDDYSDGTPCYQHRGQVPPESIDVFICMGQGRYVTIYKDSNSTDPNLSDDDVSLNICELEINGCYYGNYGDHCAEICHCRHSSCDIYLGECEIPECEDGWLGHSCDIPCINPMFGYNCSEICHCHTPGCDIATGQCFTPGCISGWDGQSCSVRVDVSKAELPDFVIPTVLTLSAVLVLSVVINLALCRYLASRKETNETNKGE